MDFATFHTTYEALVDKARTNKLVPDDFAGATITLTNPARIGTVASVPRLMKGQGSIIATGAIRTIGGAKVMTISSTYDHGSSRGRNRESSCDGSIACFKVRRTSTGRCSRVLRVSGSGMRDAGSVPATTPTHPASRSPIPTS